MASFEAFVKSTIARNDSLSTKDHEDRRDEWTAALRICQSLLPRQELMHRMEQQIPQLLEVVQQNEDEAKILKAELDQVR